MVTLNLMREYWKAHRNPEWVFPSPGRGSKKGDKTIAIKPIDRGCLQSAMHEAVKESGIKKKASVHTFAAFLCYSFVRSRNKFKSYSRISRSCID